MGQLEDALRNVALCRNGLQEATDKQKAIQARIDQTAVGRQLIWVKEDVVAIKALLARDEAHARQQTVVAYRLTSDKHPAEGASIRMTKSVDICGDMEDVKEWAIVYAPHMLQVHAPTLKKQILAGGVPEALAVIKEEPRGALAKDLSSWLTEEAETDG